MNIYALSIGILVALLTIQLFKYKRSANILPWYAWLLATFPIYYWVFALYGADSVVLIKEILVGFLFIILILAQFKIKSQFYPLLLAFGYILHAGYDFSHAWFFTNQGTPDWWPEFCGIIDAILGVYIAGFALTPNPSSVNDLY